MRTKTAAPTAYAWVILAVLCAGVFAAHGVRSSFSAYISPWELDFAAGRTMITSISTLSFLIFASAQPLAGKLNEHFGKNIVPTASLLLVVTGMFLSSRAAALWQLYICYGIIFSLGLAGTCSVMVSTIVTHWFAEKRGLALGISMSGAAAGSMVLAPVSLYVIESFGWRTTLTVLSIIITVVILPLFIFFLSNKPEDKGLLPYGRDTAESGSERKTAKAVKPLAGLFRQKTFWLLITTFFICGFTDIGLVQTHLVPIIGEKGFDVNIAALAFSVLGALNIISTLILGNLSDIFSHKKQLTILYGIRGVIYVFLIALKLPWMIILFAAVAGSVDMTTSAPTTSLVADLFNDYSVGVVLGIVSLGHQFGGAIGSWLPGLIYDVSGSYIPSIALSAVLLLGAAAMAMLIPEKRAKNRKQSASAAG